MNKIKINYHENPCIYGNVLKDYEWLILLDSCHDKGNFGRYSILSCNPTIKIISHQNKISVTEGDNRSLVIDKPLEIIKKYFKNRVADHTSELPFNSGYMGYFGYNAFSDEDLYSAGSFPDIAIGLYEWAIIVDHRNKITWLTFQEENTFISNLIDMFKSSEYLSKSNSSYAFSNLKQITPKEKYIDDIKKIKKYISDGDCYQVNYSQNFKLDFTGDPWDLYKNLRNINPAPYSSYFNFGDKYLLSCSPERFISIKDNIVETKPIKGTLKRLSDRKLDEKQKEILRKDEKNISENLMIVDLLRNDLSKCCDLNTVKVNKLFDIESFASVHHMVSTINGKLRHNISSIDLLASCFPGGSITGAPKKRSMEIIKELEKRPREVYCGSIGYFDLNNDMDTNICIRTIMICDNELYFAAGGGIVYDSDPEEEYLESLEKVSIFLKYFSKGSFKW